MEENIAIISEIYPSIQGEGIYVGARQVFVRFAGCNLHCSYCDTIYSRKFQPYCMLGKRKLKNPIALDKALDIVARYKGGFHSICLTGGEPLIQSDFLSAFAQRLKKNGHTIYLETNGTLPDAMEIIIHWVDIVSCDIKTPTDSGGVLWEEHRRFLQILSRVIPLKKVFVKFVVTEKTKKKELERAVSLLKEADKEIPLIIQPVTPKGKLKGPSSRKIKSFGEYASQYINEVRIIPQIHKIMDWK